MSGFTPSQAVIDLGAITANVSALAGIALQSDVMAVVKGDAYGHGLVPVATAALAGGASWLGVAQLDEAMALRAAGIEAPVLSWIFSPQADLSPAVAANIDLAASAPWAITRIAQAARVAGRTARVHVKIDTGMTRAGASWAQWPDLVSAALAEQGTGSIDVVGVFSHLACADVPDDPSVDTQLTMFDDAIALAARAGLRPGLRHIANSAGMLLHPRTHYDLVRPGIAVVGLSPAPEVAASGSANAWGLRPAMTLSAHVTIAKDVPAGTGVSYGHTEHSAGGRVAVVPLGYADGIPRAASATGPVLLGGERTRVLGRVCMDQFVVAATADTQVDDLAILFGPGTDGEPTADDWAVAANTINYEIVTRLGPRVPRVYVEGEQGDA